MVTAHLGGALRQPLAFPPEANWKVISVLIEGFSHLGIYERNSSQENGIGWLF